jgi:hypothetical protein
MGQGTNSRLSSQPDGNQPNGSQPFAERLVGDSRQCHCVRMAIGVA